MHRLLLHVLDLADDPGADGGTADDLRFLLALEYCVPQARLLTWDVLPDADGHLCGAAPYAYYVGYIAVARTGWDFSNREIALPVPMCSVAQLSEAEEMIRGYSQLSSAHAMSCKPLQWYSAGLEPRYGPQRSDNARD